MGNRTSSSRGGAKLGSSIVPDQDPLLRTVTQRIVRTEIARDFKMTPQVLGTGYSGAVRLAVHKATGQKVAVKQFTKRRLKAHRLKLLQGEVEVYLRLDHPNICRLLHAYEGKHDVWLVMELCGCELYSRLCERKAYKERDAADVMLQMLQAVNYLHSHRVVHRDLKLENWMYGATERDDRLKLIDFGFSRVLSCSDEILDLPCGTLHYTSPEVLGRNYTSQCDMWSLGVICYMMLLGRPPFRGGNNMKIAKAILHSDFCRDGRWEYLSEDARDFVRQLLHKDAAERLTAKRALAHRWIAGAVGGHLQSFTCDIGVDVLRSLRRFAQGSHLQRAALTVLAYSLTSRELQDLEQTFLDFDRAGNGTITLDQFREAMTGHVEVSSQEVDRIFQCFDFAHDEEMRYTPFIAALLATRVKFHEDKVRSAFEAFDRDRTGFITAEGLVGLFHGLQGAGAAPGGGLTKEEAEQWISEVDYKGNGTIDYDTFLAALTGKQHLWGIASLDSDDEPPPLVQVFEEDGAPARRRVLSDSWCSGQRPTQAGLPKRLALALVFPSRMEDDRRPHSFSTGAGEVKVQVGAVSCEIDERYFA